MYDSNRRQYGQLGRIGVVLLGLCLWGSMIWSISAYQAVNTQDANYGAAYERGNASTRIEESCIGRQGAALTKCVTEIIETTREAERAEYDLDIQSQMAFWTMLMFWATLFATSLTGIGVWFVKRTLEINSSFLNESTKANQIMSNANLIARDSHRRTIRAYVGFTDPEITDEWDGDNHKLTIEIIFKNSGATPAVNLFNFVGTHMANSDTQGPIQLFSEGVQAVLGAQQSARITLNMLVTDTEFRQRKQSGQEFCFRVQLEYTDCFGDAQSTHADFKLDGFPKGSLELCMLGNSNRMT